MFHVSGETADPWLPRQPQLLPPKTRSRSAGECADRPRRCLMGKLPAPTVGSVRTIAKAGRLAWQSWARAAGFHFQWGLFRGRYDA